ncbi:uncharacterized protein LOC100375570, partial [Saccoglossus kowalevskii]|uniref:WASH complex subunit FAM21A-like n=1 Tax=Saccoglossus kowalevskii TaxID=10224 RepID=A0ABM0M5N6_SACKO
MAFHQTPDRAGGDVVETIQGDQTSMNGPIEFSESIPSAPTTTQSSVEQVTSVGERSWEKPWTMNEIRKSSSNWSLASDSGLLLFLQEFSQKMVCRTHEIQKQVDGVLHETKSIDSKMHNVFSDFLMLSNTQFIENRVYDDAPEESESNNANKEHKEHKDEEKTREQKESELIPKLTEALSYGLSVLDNAFDKLDIKAGNSDSEDDDVAYKNDPILEPKDLYAHRPLPYLIATPAFMQDDDVGLGDIPSEDEYEESEHGSISASEEESETESEESESESESEDSSTGVRTRSKVSRKSDSSEEDDEEDDLFSPNVGKHSASDADDSEEENYSQKLNKGGGFAAELASKIGAPGPRDASDEEDEGMEDSVRRERSETTSSRESHKKNRKKKDKKSKKVKVKEEKDDDLFGPPPMDDDLEEDDDSPFGRQGKFSSGGGLFDDVDEGGLFGEPTLRNKDPVKKEKTEEEKPTESKKTKKDSALTKSGRKVPAGAVSLFGSGTDDMFSTSKKQDDDDDDDNDNDDEAVEPAAKTITSTKPQPKSLSGGLFDDNEEEDDLFAPPPMKTTSKKAKKQIDLFGDDDDNDAEEGDDLFSRMPPKEVPAQKTEEKKKKPVGGVSVFGDSDPLGEKKKAEAPVKPDKKETAKVKPSSKKAPSSGALFTDDGDLDNNLFSPPTLTSTQSKTKKTASDIFDDDDDDDDLFSTSSSTKSTPRRQQTKNDTKAKKAASSVLFDDDEDDLFSTTIQKPKDSVKKKPVGGVSIFGGADLFGESKSESTDKATVKEKEPEIPTTQRKPRSKSKSLFADEDVLFGGSEEAPDIDLFSPSSPLSPDKPVASSLKKTEAVKTKPKPAAKGLFGDDDDDDDLFSITKKAAPKKEVKQSRPSQKVQKPATKTKQSSLFGTEDDDDLFGAAKKAEPRKEIKKDSPAKNKIPDTVPVKGATTTESSTDILGNENDDDMFTVKKVETTKTEKIKAPLEQDDEEDELFGGPKIKPEKPVKKKIVEKDIKTDKLEKSPPDDVKPPISKEKKEPVQHKDPFFDVGEDDADGLFSRKSPVLEPSKPTTSIKPPTQSSNSTSVPSSDSSLSNSASSSPRKEATSNIGKLQASLDIKPSSLLPGARPPERTEEPSAVSFDEPAKLSTLHTLQK